MYNESRSYIFATRNCSLISCVNRAATQHHLILIRTPGKLVFPSPSQSRHMCKTVIYFSTACQHLSLHCRNGHRHQPDQWMHWKRHGTTGQSWSADNALYKRIVTWQEWSTAGILVFRDRHNNTQFVPFR